MFDSPTDLELIARHHIAERIRRQAATARKPRTRGRRRAG